VALGVIETIKELEAEGALKVKLSPTDHKRLSALERRANEQLAAEGGEGVAN